ncbi:MAG TPA: alpha-mannosidase, partial [Alphaproteobacteria bacterium]|nr:alpha-mannosidase [Alphaproteobacteria bacterium]
MTLTLAQRIDRIRVRLDELLWWRERESVAVEGWTFEGEPIAVGGFWPRHDGAVALAAQGRVPEHWPLAESRLILDFGGEALVSLGFAGGETVRYGVDPYHREFPIRGHEFSINAEAVARLPFGEPVREPRLAVARLAWIELPVHALHLRLKQIVETCELLAGHDVVEPLVQAAEQAFYGLEWPSATAPYTSRFAGNFKQRKIWRYPDVEGAPVPLDDVQRTSVMKADLALVDALRALQGRYPPVGDLLLTGHAHIDLAWLWPYAETRRKLRRTFHTALSLMEGSNEYLVRSGFTFNQSTAQYYAQIEEDDPELFEAIAAKIKAGSWETVGGMWVEPDTNMPTGESLARQLLYGQRYFERKFGIRHTVCWLPDCFGFSGALPQLLKQAGINSFFTIKVNWNENNKFPVDLFWWEGLDGSRVLAHTFENPRGGYNGELGPEAYLSTWRNFRQKALHGQSLLAIGYGDGGGGVTPEFVEREMQLRDFPVLPTARWGR